jgi:hypothetical protein
MPVLLIRVAVVICKRIRAIIDSYTVVSSPLLRSAPQP